jgi:hypothetical protein
MRLDGLAILVRTRTGVAYMGCVGRSGPSWWPPPQDKRCWDYFGCSGRCRSVPLDGARSIVPGAF